MIKLKTLLAEQSSAWDSIKPIGNNPKGLKEIVTTIPAAVNLTINGKQTTMNTETKNGIIPYVGAYIESKYNESNALAALQQIKGLNSTNGRFGCRIHIYISSIQNATMRTTGAPGGSAESTDFIPYIVIQIYQTADGTFQLIPYNAIAQNKNWSSNTNRFISPGFFSYKLNQTAETVAKNLSGQIGDTYKKINLELLRLGFPELPNSIDLTTSVTL